MELAAETNNGIDALVGFGHYRTDNPLNGTENCPSVNPVPALFA